MSCLAYTTVPQPTGHRCPQPHSVSAQLVDFLASHHSHPCLFTQFWCPEAHPVGTGDTLNLSLEWDLHVSQSKMQVGQVISTSMISSLFHQRRPHLQQIERIANYARRTSHHALDRGFGWWCTRSSALSVNETHNVTINAHDNAIRPQKWYM